MKFGLPVWRSRSSRARSKQWRDPEYGRAKGSAELNFRHPWGFKSNRRLSRIRSSVHFTPVVLGWHMRGGQTSFPEGGEMMLPTGQSTPRTGGKHGST
jgi:hypothetical protein